MTPNTTTNHKQTNNWLHPQTGWVESLNFHPCQTVMRYPKTSSTFHQGGIRDDQARIEHRRDFHPSRVLTDLFPPPITTTTIAASIETIGWALNSTSSGQSRSAPLHPHWYWRSPGKESAFPYGDVVRRSPSP